MATPTVKIMRPDRSRWFCIMDGNCRRRRSFVSGFAAALHQLTADSPGGWSPPKSTAEKYSSRSDPERALATFSNRLARQRPSTTLLPPVRNEGGKCESSPFDHAQSRLLCRSFACEPILLRREGGSRVRTMACRTVPADPDQDRVHVAGNSDVGPCRSVPAVPAVRPRPAHGSLLLDLAPLPSELPAELPESAVIWPARWRVSPCGGEAVSGGPRPSGLLSDAAAVFVVQLTVGAGNLVAILAPEIPAPWEPRWVPIRPLSLFRWRGRVVWWRCGQAT
jgi:hypothetical protein